LTDVAQIARSFKRLKATVPQSSACFLANVAVIRGADGIEFGVYTADMEGLRQVLASIGPLVGSVIDESKVQRIAIFEQRQAVPEAQS
jgi:hypothetical protein